MGVEEGKILYSGMMGQCQVENPYQGRPGEQAGKGKISERQASVSFQKKLVRNLLSNNCLQKCKTGAKEAEESLKQHGKAGSQG